MNILVINGSAKKEHSDSFQVTRAFLEGMQADYKVLNTADLNIRPCRGCYSCWFRTPGTCILRDDMDSVWPLLTEADLVIFSMPLYFYSMPASCKALVDRMILLASPKQNVDENGMSYHPAQKELHASYMLISGCGFPNREGNYDGLIWQFKRSFGQECPMILCVEAPLLASELPEALAYLETARKAGEAFAKTHVIPEELQKVLDAPMISPDVYRELVGK